MLCQKEMCFWSPTVQLVFALHSLLLLLLSLERPQRKRRGFVCLYPLNRDIPKVVCLKSMGLQWKEPKSPCLHPQLFIHRIEERKPSVWQYIPVLSCLQVRNRSYALLVKRQQIAECWDFFLQFSQVGKWAWILYSIPSSPGSIVVAFVTLQGNTATCLSAAANPAESSLEWNYTLDGKLGCSHITEHLLKFPLVVALNLGPTSDSSVGSSNTKKIFGSWWLFNQIDLAGGS